MKMPFAIIAACVGTLTLAATLAHAGPTDPIPGTIVGLEHCPPDCPKMKSQGTNTTALPKTQQQKAGTATAKQPISVGNEGTAVIRDKK